MRNQVLFKAATVLFVAIGVCGCTVDEAPPADNPQLASGYRALGEQQSELAIERADQFLRANPSGPGSSEALYLKGRGFEQKTASDPAEMKRNLLEARMAYADALNQHPSRSTEGYIRASLSNVAFFQDDFPTSFAEASKAYGIVESPAIQSVLLYRMGVCEQRMGRFSDADRTFQSVQSRYSNTPIARSAGEHIGLRNFYLQLATYNTAAGADRAIASLQNSRVTISKHTDSGGHTVIDAGPFPNYETAKDMQTRFGEQYPDALIVP
jgi:outer membrane protein assembly factor BamD (BamD/ComL family)